MNIKARNAPTDWQFCRVFGWLLALLIVPHVGLAQSDASASPLSPHDGRYVSSNTVDWERQQQIAGGYLVSMNQDGSSLTLTSLSSLEETQVSVTFGGSAPMRLLGGTVISADKLAVIGIYRNSGFLAYTDFSGTVKQYVDLGPYVPLHVCATSDGETWTLGQNMEKEGLIWTQGNSVSAGDDQLNYGLLRAYSADGKLEQSQFKRAAIAGAATDPSSKLFVNIGPRGSALACGSESVGAYVAVQGRAFWHEFIRKTGAERDWAIGNSPEALVLTGLAVPLANTPYASFGLSGGGLGIFRLELGNNGGAQWQRVLLRPNGSSAGAPSLKILGSSAGEIVYINGVSAAAPQMPIVALSDVPRGAVTAAISLPGAGATGIPARPPTPRDVNVLVSNADMLLRRITAAPAVCSTQRCQAAVSSLRGAINTWEADNSRGARSAAGDAQAATQIRASFLEINASLAEIAARPGSFQKEHSQLRGEQSPDYVPLSAAATDSCQGDCGMQRTPYASSAIGGGFLVPALNLEAPVSFGEPYGGHFVRVDCSAQCSDQLAIDLSLCAVGTAYTGSKSLFWGSVVGIACIMVSAYINLDCEQTCGEMEDCQPSSLYWHRREDVFANVRRQLASLVIKDSPPLRSGGLIRM